MHNALLHDKRLLHYHPVYAAGVVGPAERLKEARIKAGYDSAKAASEAMGVALATYTQHENGARGFPAEKAKRYARFFKVTPEWLLYGKSGALTFDNLGALIFVKGEVQAGVWKEVWETAPDEWEAFTGRADISAPIKDRFGLRVVGESMNELYPPGSIVECVAYDGSYQIPSHKRVIVQRVRFGQEIETTVKELVRSDDGVEWLVPRSTNPAFQTPIRCDDPGSDIESINIIAVVVASVRPE
jgi:SOS-response transcriptional repressor LexA